MLTDRLAAQRQLVDAECVGGLMTESSMRGGMQLGGLAVASGTSDATIVPVVLVHRSKGYFNAAARVQIMMLPEKASARAVGLSEAPRARVGPEAPDSSHWFPFAWTAGGQQFRGDTRLLRRSFP